MDLLTAKKEAQKESRAQKGKIIYVVVDDEGEVDYSLKQSATTLNAYRNGSEISFNEIVKSPKTKPTKISKEAAIGEKEKLSSSKTMSVKKSNKILNSEIMKNSKNTSAKKSSKSVKEVPAKKSAAKKEKAAPVKRETTVEKSKLGASFFFDDSALKRLNAILKRENLSFNAWANKLVKDKVK